MNKLSVVICFIFGFFIGLLPSSVLYYKYEASEKHIEYLELFLDLNQLPTPARRP